MNGNSGLRSLSDLQLQGLAEKVSQEVPFYADYLGRFQKAKKGEGRLARISSILEERSLSPVTAATELTPQQQEQEWLRFAGQGSPQAAQAAIALQMLGQRRAEETLDTAGGKVSPEYARVVSWVRSQMANPEAIDEGMQRMIEGGIRREGAQASAGYERRLRESLGARGLPGTPALSGAGITQLGGFERELAGDVGQRLQTARIQRALANTDYERGIAQFAAELARNDPSLQLALAKAGIQAGIPAQTGGYGFSQYASLLAAMEAADKAGDTSFMDKYGGLLEALVGAGATVATGGVAAPAVAAGVTAKSLANRYPPAG